MEKQYFTLETFRGQPVFNAEVVAVYPLEDFVAVKLVGWECPVPIDYADMKQAFSSAPKE